MKEQCLPVEARTSLLLQVEAELAKCAKCGACSSVCPVYGETHNEANCARGKLMLARALAKGNLPVTGHCVEIFNNCLLCLACVKNCASGVRLDTVVMAVRAMLVQHVGQVGLKKLLYRGLLASPERMRAVMKGASLVQKLAFGGLPAHSGLLRRYALPLVPVDQPVPCVVKHPVYERYAAHRMPVETGGSDSVLYFTGCAANYFFPTVAEATFFVLHSLGYVVHLPEQQVCCGTPAHVGGERESVRHVARKNIALLSASTGPVLTSCGSCGLMLQQHYTHIFAGQAEEEAAKALGKRTFDICAFLWDVVGLERLIPLVRRSIPHVLTYHDPCHLHRGQGVCVQPRALLRMVCPHFAEMQEAGRCCGSGGVYVASHWNIAKSIVARKHAQASGVGATLMATGCPSCMLHLDGGGPQNRPRQGVFHSIEILAWSMGYMPQDTMEQQRFALHLGEGVPC